MWVLHLCIAAFACFIDVVRFSTELQRQIFRRGHVMGLHQFLLLGRPRFASREGLLKYRRRCRSDRGPFVELLTEEIRLEAQENLCTLDLSKIETLRRHFFRVGHDRIDIRTYEVPKCLRG